MVAAIDDLLNLLDLRTVHSDRFLGPAPETTLQRVFGGQVLAQALVAATRCVVPERGIHSLHGYFIAGGEPGVEIQYEVDRIRDGRSFSNRRVLASQHGRTIFHMTASFQVEEVGFDHQAQIPRTPGPKGMPTHQDRLGEAGRHRSTEEWAVLEVRHATPDDRRDQQWMWMRTVSALPDDPVVHAAVLAYASDLDLLGTSLRPHGIGLERTGVATASIDHAMWFHRPFRADEWLLYDTDTPSASGGRGLSRGRIFDQSGALVATTVQEGLMRQERST